MAHTKSPAAVESPVNFFLAEAGPAAGVVVEEEDEADDDVPVD